LRKTRAIEHAKVGILLDPIGLAAHVANGDRGEEHAASRLLSERFMGDDLIFADPSVSTINFNNTVANAGTNNLLNATNGSVVRSRCTAASACAWLSDARPAPC
jgi:hypothetical protein